MLKSAFPEATYVYEKYTYVVQIEDGIRTFRFCEKSSELSGTHFCIRGKSY